MFERAAVPEDMTSCPDCQRDFSPRAEEERLLTRIRLRFGDEEFTFPTPKYCPACRQRRRLLFRNERQLYHNTTMDGKKHVSLYHPVPVWGAPYQVLEEPVWRSDALDPLQYGMEFDFARPFFDQYRDLHKAVPRMSVANIENENCPFTSHTGYSKDSYLIPCSEYCESCYYGRFLQNCKNCVDCTNIYKCELCYECLGVTNCYHCFFLTLSENCSDCFFSENLIGCAHCLFSTNLHRKEYCIFNERVSKAEFEDRCREIFETAESLEAARNTWLEVRRNRVHRATNVTSCENCTGDFITHSKNCVDCYDLNDCEDCAHSTVGVGSTDCVDCSNVYVKTELCYQLAASMTIYHGAYCLYTFRSRDIYYCEYIYDSQDLFGCVGIKRGRHCILNRQYGEREYNVLVPKIIRHMQSTGEWGEFFPPQMSPFGYNETVAFECDPLSRHEVIERKWLWRDTDPREAPKITAESPPAKIADADDSVCKQIFRCQETGASFKIIAQELAFLQREHIPLPQVSPHARHLRRERLRNPREFWQRNCNNCGTAIFTNISPDRPEQVFCDDCFRRSMF